MELKYVPATPDDVDEIFSCLKEVLLFREPYLADHENALMQLYRRIKDNITEYALVKYNGERAAFFYFHKDGDMMKLEDFYVFQHLRYKGIATAILRRCMSETERPIKAEIYASDPYAFSLFRHHAFKLSEWLDKRRYIAVNQNDFPYIPELFYDGNDTEGPTIY